MLSTSCEPKSEEKSKQEVNVQEIDPTAKQLDINNLVNNSKTLFASSKNYKIIVGKENKTDTVVGIFYKIKDTDYYSQVMMEGIPFVSHTLVGKNNAYFDGNDISIVDSTNLNNTKDDFLISGVTTYDLTSISVYNVNRKKEKAGFEKAVLVGKFPIPDKGRAEIRANDYNSDGEVDVGYIPRDKNEPQYILYNQGNGVFKKSDNLYLKPVASK